MPSDAEKEILQASSPPHFRMPWEGNGCAEVLVHSRWDVLKGTQQGLRLGKSKVSALYEAAKRSNDVDAAHALIDAVWHQPVLDELVKRVIQTGKRPVLVHPHPAFDDEDCIDHDAADRLAPRNALPFAYAARLKTMLNGFDNAPVIVQSARVGRTKLCVATTTMAG